jgi:hypothetical protein
MSNADVESRAIELVVAYEMKRRNITTKDSIVHMPRGEGYDIQSGERKIEVKGSEGNAVNTGFRLNSSQEIAFVMGGGYVYRVLDVFGSPRLYILDGAKLTLYRSEWASVSAPKELLISPIDL